jgi:hypothetical protein
LDDAELLARIRGQTRDLPISLFSDTSIRVSHPSEAQLQAIARQHSAEFVVSVDQEPNGSRSVYVLDVRAAELRVRSAPAPDRKHRFARSAAAETVALIVRGELSDALAARASRASEEARGKESTPSAATPPEHASPANATPGEPSTSATARTVTRPDSTTRAAEPGTSGPGIRDEDEDEDKDDEHEDEDEDEDGGGFSLGIPPISLELAGRASTAIDDRYFFGALLNVRLSFDYFSVGVTASSTLANRAEIQGLTLTLREHGFGVDALAHLPLTAATRLGLGVAGRWLFYRRSGESGNPEWNPEPADTSSTLAVGPQAELRWQLLQHLGASVRIGLDVLLRPISWRYRLDTNPRVPIELERQNRAQPWLAVGVYGNL